MLFKVGIFLILYFMVIPLTSYSVISIKRNIQRKRRIKPQKIEDPLQALSLSQNFNRYKTFGIKEANNKSIVITLYILSILLAPALSFINIFLAIGAVIISPFLFGVLNKILVQKELQERDVLISRLIDFKRSKMGLQDNKSNVLTYENEFQILEWGEDKKPEKIRLFLPVTFDPLNAVNFLRDFSTQFGRGRPFEIDYQDKECPGWDTDKGVATLKLEAPLPTLAKWDAHYLEDPIVQWSFFPLGLGSKGGLPIKNPETGEIEHVIGIDVDGTQAKYCAKNNIPVGKDIVASPMTLIAGVTGGGKSVAQWNLMNACLARPKEWLLFGMDMKKVELSQLRQFGVAVGTTYQDCRDVACFVQKVMMDRYEKMEKLRINNWSNLPKDDEDYGSPAILLLCDEAGELLAPIAGKSDEAKEQQECQDQIRAAMESIARLGRASKVFLCAAAQRPSSDIIPMQIRQNMSNKLACGTIPQTISGMLFENNEGAKIPGTPRGRCALKVHSEPVNHFQGFFSPEADWFIEYADSKGWPREIYGADSLNRDLESSSASDEEEAMDMSDFELLERAK
jgi:hypothetical protein